MSDQMLGKLIAIIQSHLSGLSQNISQLSLTCTIKSVGWLAKYSSNVVRTLIYQYSILEIID